jgi:hypothetical protein
MTTKLPLSQVQLCLPNIYLIESSEQAFGDAFLRAAQILDGHLKQIKSAIGVIQDFKRDAFNLAILGLFSKMCSHYSSYFLLEIHHDRIGSQFLIEHLSEAAITLTYLLEEVDNSLFSEYIFASVHQAHYLLIDVEEQLQKFPNHPDLLSLKDKLETFIAKEHKHAAERPLTAYSEAYLWGPQEANTTAKRGAVIGLNFLTNPARQIALSIMPASWLELKLSYLNSFATRAGTKAKPGINFTCLRDASHLCLHATQSFLEEVVNHQQVNLPDIESKQQILNLLYEWFHNAHKVYQQRCSATIQEKDGL